MVRKALVALVLFTSLISLSGALDAYALSTGRLQPTLAWQFDSMRVTAGQPSGLDYSISGLQHGDRLLFQRRFGEHGVWRTVVNIPARNTGSTEVPAVSMGRFVYRAKLTSGLGVLRTTSGVRFLYSYGTVSLATLGSAPGMSSGGEFYPGTVEVGSVSFTYELVGTGSDCNASPNWCTELNFPATTCRAVTLHFAVQQSNDSATVQFLEPRRALLHASTSFGTMGILQGELDGYPWSFQDDSPGGSVIYYSGHFSCWTPDG